MFIRVFENVLYSLQWKKDSSICKFIFYYLLDLDFHINVLSVIKVKQ